MSLTTNITSAVSASIDRLFSDQNLVREITWSLKIGQTHDSVNQVSQTVYVDYPVRGIYLEREKFIAPSPGQIGMKVTECSYLIRVAELPEDFSRNDKIVDRSKAFKIEKIQNLMDTAVKVEVIAHD
jgi:hypothetical protein